MASIPFSRFSHPYYHPYYRNYYSRNPNSMQNNVISDNVNEKSQINNEPEKKEPRIANSSHSRSFGPIRFNFDDPFDVNKDEPIIDILGISLYLDDLIIIGLLFFLYQEGVKDDMLFLALILLLLT